MKTSFFDNPTFAIGHWRERFEALKPNLPGDWRQRILKMNPKLDSVKGATVLNLVTRGEASLENTAGVVELLEKIIQQKSRSSRSVAGQSARERIAAVK